MAAAPVYVSFAILVHHHPRMKRDDERDIMRGGAQLSVTELRRAARHPVDFPVIGEHRQHGDLKLRVVNISAHGFMTEGETILGRGERVTIRLPAIGRIEAFMIWTNNDRAGFQFERVLRLDDFLKMINSLQPSVRLRPQRHASS